MKIFANKNIWKKTICDFLVTVCDAAVNIIHRLMLGQDLSLIRVDLNNGWLKIARIAIAFLVAAVVVFGITAGAYIALKAISGFIISKAGAIAALLACTYFAIQTGLYVGSKTYSLDWWDNRIDIPVYSITPEEIFRGSIPLFNVNFFDPSTETIGYAHLQDYDWGEYSFTESKGYAVVSGMKI